MSPEAIAPAPERAETHRDDGDTLVTKRATEIHVRDNGGGIIPPVSFFLRSGDAQMNIYLTAEEAHIAAGLLVAAANKAGAPS